NASWSYPTNVGPSAGYQTQAGAGDSGLPAFRCKVTTPQSATPEEVIEDATGGYVVVSFDIFADAEGTQRVGQFRGVHEYDYFQDPEHHRFELTSLGDGTFHVGNFRFGHSYAYLNGGPLWGLDAWMSESPVLQQFGPGQRITVPLDWAGRLPYPTAPGPGLIIARNPGPADRATDVPADALLSWTAGAAAQTHDVYLGTVYADVDAASRATPLNVLVSRDQNATTYNPPAPLRWGQTYYWRVDEIGPAPASKVVRGRVWHFTAEPFSYPITRVIATAASFDTNMGPEKTIDGSGLNQRNEHSTVSTHMWLSNKAGSQPTWIQYAFDKVYELHEMWVWNFNQIVEPVLGFGAKSVMVAYSTDGSTWTTLGTFAFARGMGLSTYAPNTTVPFSGAAARYVKLTIQSNWGGIVPQYGLSEVRFFHVPRQAREPVPANGAAGVELDVTLRWRPGRQAASHRVYLGTDQNAVANGTTTAQTIGHHSLVPASLDFGTTYHWRVDEVGGGICPGEVWSFTTREFAVVDDFESYTDDEGSRIFDAWIDGWTNRTGSVVGYLQAPFAEWTIFHSGRQAMPLEYNNVKTPFYSEAQRTWSTVQNWTGNGATMLRLWFRGHLSNAPGTLYVEVEDKAGKRKTVNHPNAKATTFLHWTEWRIARSDLTGVDLKAVKKLAIGVDHRLDSKAGGAGRLYFDDIGFGRPLSAGPTK
ncbi:MAG: discoidin domain-containing protein, partial [Planctomycetes bacterium]|nr:discoidin domain-containing protein [Planctomycetota bacterium]